MSTTIRSPQEFLKKFTEVAAPPLTGAQLEAKIGELSLALESATLAPEMRKQIEAARADLIRLQFIAVHGFLPDADGNRPLDVAAIAERATAKVLHSLSPESVQAELESIPDADDDQEVNLDEQNAALNEIDEVDHAGVASVESTISAPVEVVPPLKVQRGDGAVLLSAEVCSLLRASLKAGLQEVTNKILWAMLND